MSSSKIQKENPPPPVALLLEGGAFRWLQSAALPPDATNLTIWILWIFSQLCVITAFVICEKNKQTNKQNNVKIPSIVPVQQEILFSLCLTTRMVAHQIQINCKRMQCRSSMNKDSVTILPISIQG